MKSAIILLLLALLIPICLSSNEHPFLRYNSVFNPRVRSKAFLSLLSENELYQDRPFVFRQETRRHPSYLSLMSTSLSALDDSTDTDPGHYRQPGLSHPFESMRTFRKAFLEAFRTREPQYCIAGYTYADSSLTYLADLNFKAGYEHSYNQDFSYGLLYKGFGLNAIINKNFGLRANWWSGAYFGDADSARVNSPLVDSFVKAEDELWLDNLNADIYYHNKYLTLALGRGRFQIGNSISGSIILSDRTNEYGYFLAEGGLGALTLSFLHGSLVADSTLAAYEPASGTPSTYYSKNYPQKHLALHQFSYNIKDRLQLFMGESVVYGDRGIDLNYLLPHTFWRVTEHNLQDRDNVLIFGGLNWKATEGSNIYLQTMLDEFRYKELFGNWWGNKYALQGGINLAFPNPLNWFYPVQSEPELTLEFTAIRPYTYTHYLDHNKYSHDQHPLGYPKGSNSIDYSAELVLPFARNSEIVSHVSYTRQGSVGNQFSMNYHDLMTNHDETQLDWLAGKITDTIGLRNTYKLGIFSHHNILAAMDLDYVSEWKARYSVAWQFIY